MASITGLTIVKQFTYRGKTDEEWSNQYFFTDAPPSDRAGWITFADALIALEKTVYSSRVKVVAAYGYDDDAVNAHAVFVYDLSATPVSGTLATSGAPALPGDAAVLLSWKLDHTNSRGKPVYLRKYFHDAYSQSAVDEDPIHDGQAAALMALGTALFDGSFDSGRLIRARSGYHSIIEPRVDPWVTTRTLKRRGKRPS